MGEKFIDVAYLMMKYQFDELIVLVIHYMIIEMKIEN